MGQAYTFLLKAVALCAAAFFIHDKRQPLARLPFVVDATGNSNLLLVLLSFRNSKTVTFSVNVDDFNFWIVFEKFAKFCDVNIH